MNEVSPYCERSVSILIEVRSEDSSLTSVFSTKDRFDGAFYFKTVTSIDFYLTYQSNFVPPSVTLKPIQFMKFMGKVETVRYQDSHIYRILSDKDVFYWFGVDHHVQKESLLILSRFYPIKQRSFTKSPQLPDLRTHGVFKYTTLRKGVTLPIFHPGNFSLIVLPPREDLP